MQTVADLIFSILGFLAGVGVTVVFYEIRGKVFIVTDKRKHLQRPDGQADN